MTSETLVPYISTLLIAITLSTLTNFLFIKISPLLRLIDKPNERKFQPRSIPLGGGISIFISFFLSLLVAKFFFGQPFVNFGARFYGLFICGAIMTALGIWDDYADLNAFLKLLIQALCAVLLVHFGYQVEVITLPFRAGEFQINMAVSIVIGILWMVAIINSINLIDGIDGLCGGITFFAAITLFFLFSIREDYFAPLMMLVLVGCTLGFLIFNFPPAKIYLGNGGSLFNGFLLGAIGLYGFQKASTTIALMIPIATLAIPLTDTALAIIRRGRIDLLKIFKADRYHLHHRLIRIGISPRKLVFIMYFCSVLLGLSAILLNSLPQEYVIVFIAMFIMFLLLFSKILHFVERFLGMRALDFRRISLFERDKKIISLEQLGEILKHELSLPDPGKRNFDVVICNVDGMLREHSKINEQTIKKEIIDIFQLFKGGLRDGDFVTYVGAEQFAIFMLNLKGSLPTHISRINDLFSKKFDLERRDVKLRVTDVIHATERDKLQKVVGYID
jgi:UDP-GlcNAc:undecaprenyl-phosphate GlcNAc-1-phosphate transferase